MEIDDHVFQLVNAMFREAQSLDRDSGSFEAICDLMDAAVLRILMTFFHERYLLCPLGGTLRAELFDPYRCYRISALYEIGVVTHAFVMIAPFFNNQDTPSLIERELQPLLNDTALFPKRDNFSRWVIVFSDLPWPNARFFLFQTSRDTNQGILIPVTIDESTTGERLGLQETQIHVSFDFPRQSDSIFLMLDLLKSIYPSEASVRRTLGNGSEG